MPRATLPHLPLADLCERAGLTAEASRARVTSWAPDPRSPHREGCWPSEVALLASRCGYTRRQVHRWALEGIPFYTADRVAVGLGLHPANVWADWWDVCTIVSDMEADAETDRWLSQWLRTRSAEARVELVTEANALENWRARVERYHETREAVA